MILNVVKDSWSPVYLLYLYNAVERVFCFALLYYL